MKRRHFLRSSLFGAAALTLPAWLGCAFGGKSEWAFDDSDFQQGATLGGSYLRAQKAGKPLLVFVAPALPASPKGYGQLSQSEKDNYREIGRVRYERGHSFGELLNYGTEAQRWPLALCEVVCALPEEIAELTGSFEGAPLMALIETDSERPPLATPLDAELPSYRDLEDQERDWEKAQKREAEVIQERIALLAGLIKGALAPDAKTLARRVTQARAALPVEHRDLEKKLNTKGFTAAQADTIAALVAEGATKNTKLYALLTRAVDERLCKPPIEGSRWGRASGCGTSYETAYRPKNKAAGEEVDSGLVVMMGCGMGHVPEKSQRFIDFYTEESV